MTIDTTRALNFEGKTFEICLDEGTWQAIDWLAASRRVQWPDLAREWATLGSHGPSGDNNLTRVIRSAAMNALLNETILLERANTLAHLPGPIWQSLGMCGDRDFGDALAEASSIEAYEDFGGFVITTGTSEHGNVTFYIANNFRDGMNVIISTPIPQKEWAQRMEG